MKRYRSQYVVNEIQQKRIAINDLDKIIEHNLIKSMTEAILKDNLINVETSEEYNTIDGLVYSIDIVVAHKNDFKDLLESIWSIRELIPNDKFVEIINKLHC